MTNGQREKERDALHHEPELMANIRASLRD
jgi:hypothetical protein